MTDYRSTPIWKDGHRVTRLRVIGLLSEKFLGLAIHDHRGLNCLAWHDANPSIKLTNVLVNGRDKDELAVVFSREDAELGLRIAKAAVDVLLETGLPRSNWLELL
jgi:hypothetical protein